MPINTPGNSQFIRLAPVCAVMVMIAGCQDLFRTSPTPDQPASTIQTSAVPMPRTGIKAWAEGPTTLPDPKSRRPINTSVYSESDNVIQLVGAAGEWVAFEYLLRPERGHNPSIQLAVDDFSGGGSTIPGSSVRMYRHESVKLSRLPAWYLRSQSGRRGNEFPDVLIPLGAGGESIALESNKTTPIWVEFQIPPAAAAGRYASNIHVREAGGGSLKTAISLRVRGFALPTGAALPAPTRVSIRSMILGDDPSAGGADLLGLLRDESRRAAVVKAFAMLQAHGLSPFTDELLPAYTEATDGSVVIDWSAYDAFCGPLIDGSAYSDRRPAYIWPLPATSQYPDPSRYEGADSTHYAAVVRDYLAKAKAHFESKGWGAQAVVMFDPPTAGLPQKGDGARVKRLGKLTHVADKSLRFVSSAIPQSMGPFGWHDYPHEDLSDCVDIWCPPARFQHPPTLAEQRARGKKTWLLPDRPPFSGSIAIEAPWTHPRSVPWQAFLHEHHALYLPGSTRWPEHPKGGSISRPDDPDAIWLLYHGPPFGQSEPVPSVRLKQLRLGLQDYCYLKALADHGRGATAKVTVSSLIKAAGTDAYGDNYQDAQFDRRMDSADAWYAARKLIEDELADVLGDKSAGGMDIDTNRMAWGRMLDSTRAVRISVDSARLSRDTKAENESYLATFAMTVRNELPRPFSGLLKFGLLPITWRNMSDVTRVGPIAEMGTARARLVAGMSQFPACDLEGHIAQKIVLDAGKGETIETIGRLSILYMGKATGAIKVDGDLSDWPPSEGNAAGGFIVIAGGSADRPLAQSRTLAYFCQNESTLFIAIHADKPANRSSAGGVASTSRFGNVVTYEDLMPVAEDLVEILLDPTGRAAAPDDLYHIVIKASGQAIFEQGIEMTPPIGRSRPWVAEQKYAIESSDKSWTAEIAIPRSAFGRGAGKARIWGLNVTRLDPVRNEYSNWAAVQRHCYDPSAMGNMVWP